MTKYLLPNPILGKSSLTGMGVNNSMFINSLKQLSWKQGTVVNSTKQLQWDITPNFTVVNVNKQLQWKQGASVQNTKQLQWKQFTSVLNSKQLQWKLGASVNSTKQLSWKQFKSINSIQQLQWKQFTSVNNTQQIQWKQFKSVNNIQQIQWKQGTSVNSTKQIQWNQYASINSTKQLQWNLGASVSNSKQLQWNLGASVNNSKLIQWKQGASVSNSKQIQWNQYASINSTKQLQWMQGASVNSTKQLQWNQFISVNSTKQLQWNITWESKGNAPGYVADFDSRFGITMNGSNQVSNWVEKFSTNGMHFSQVNASQMPVFTSNVLGTVPSLVWTGSASQLLTGNGAAKNIIMNTSAVTFYGIWRFKSTGNECIFNTTQNGSSGGRYLIGQYPSQNTTSGITFTGISGGGCGGDAGAISLVSGNNAQTPDFQFSTGITDFSGQTGSIYSNNILTGKASITATGSVPNSASQSVMIGAQDSSGTNDFNGDLVRLIICNGAHTTAQRAAMWTGILSEYASETGFYAPITTSATPSLLVQIYGDDNIQGNTLSLGSKTVSDYLWNAYGGSLSTGITNNGYNGATSYKLNTMAPDTVNRINNGEATKEVIVLLVGLNDAIGSTPGSTTFSNVQGLTAAFKTANSTRKVVCCTYPAWGGGTSTTRGYLYNFNTLLKAGPNPHIDAICDLGAISQCLNDGTNAAASNTTYYNADLTHWTPALNSIIATAIQTTVNSL